MSDDAVNEVLAREAELRAALGAHDVETVDRLYAPEFTLNSPAMRTQTRAETLDLAARKELRQLDVERTVEAAYSSGDDIVVVMGHESLVWQGTNTDHDGRRTTRRFTNVWRRIDGHWRQIARQATTAPNRDASASEEER